MREFGSEFDNIPIPDDYVDNQCNKFVNHAFTRSGREAISLVAKSIIDKNTKGHAIILLPSYICPSMISAFVNDTWIIKYYFLNSDFSINKEDILSKIKLYDPTCILIVNYFGCTHDNNIFNLIKEEKRDIHIIYDVTHSLLLLPQIYYKNIDYYVASIRKWFGISDGGLVLTNTYLNYDYVMVDECSLFLELREKALNLKKNYLSINDNQIKKQFKNNLKTAESILEPNMIYCMSSKSIFKIKSLNILDIQEKRNINLKHLWYGIKSLPKIKPAIDSIEDRLNDISFMLPILVAKRDEIQNRFALNGLYTQVIWDIPNDAKICKNSYKLSKKILCIPIDQRYNYWDIEDIIEIFKKEISK